MKRDLLKDIYADMESYGGKTVTVGGWVSEQFGTIPPIGQLFRFRNLEIKVVKATKQKVLKIRSRYDEDLPADEEK